MTDLTVTPCQEQILSDRLSGGCLTLWDSPDAPPADTQNVYTWNGHSEDSGVRSVLRYAETHDIELRTKYLAWVQDLGEFKVEGSTLVKHLALDDGLSYWWLTLIAEKNPFKSPTITDAIRLFAVERMIAEDSPSEIRLFSANDSLNEAIGGLCRKIGIKYAWKRLRRRRRSRLRAAYESLPPAVRALATLTRYVLERWPIVTFGKPDCFGKNGDFFFCSDFYHLDSAAAKDGRYQSQYWGKLPALLRREGIGTNWIQFFSPHGAVPTAQAGVSILRGFNQSPRENGCHAFLDGFLTWAILRRTFRQWLKLMVLFRRLRACSDGFQPSGSAFSLYPLMWNDWKNSLCGPVAINNLLWISLFDRALEDIPRQVKGLYLCENQGWERALINAWRKHRHGELIAVVHSTVRFWDLRYFHDPRSVRDGREHAMPQADVVALNGKAAARAFSQADYPPERTAECEALRYEYLSDLLHARPSQMSPRSPRRVLILGDYVPAATKAMLQLLEAAAPRVQRSVSFTIKPHPNYPVSTADFPHLGLSAITGPLGESIKGYDLAYASNMTSASVDAFLASLPVIVLLNESELNYSPLRGHEGVRFVATADELSDALESAPSHGDQSGAGDYFFLDPSLPRWRSLLFADSRAAAPAE